MICKILENLYIGPAVDVPLSRELGVDTVVNVAHGISDSKYADMFEEGALYQFPMYDSDIDQTDTMIQARDCVIKLLNNGHTVYLHCAAGLSRSAIVAILVLEKTQGMSWRKAEDYLKNHNPGSKIGLNHRLLNRTIKGIRSRRSLK